MSDGGNLFGTVAALAAKFPQRTIVCARDGSWSAAELAARVRGAVDVLLAEGVRPGDVVFLACQAERTALVFMLGIAAIGATVFTVPKNMPDEQATSFIGTLAARWLVVDGPQRHALAVNRILVSTAAAPASASASGFEPPAAPAAPWTLALGSGSTGRPKLMPISHHSQLVRMRCGPTWLPYDHSALLVTMVTMDFYAAKQRFLEALFRGAPMWVDGFDALLAAAPHSTMPPIALYGTAFHAQQLLALRTPAWDALRPRIGCLMIGGSTVSMDLRKKIREQFCERLFILYGTNETHTSTCTRLPQVFDTDRTVGVPHPGFTVEIVDRQDRPLGRGVPGLIRIKSPATIAGYLGDDEATREHFRDGWFYPGDVGILTTDGQLIHRGRADGMMVMNGINIFPAEIEQAVATHPAVADCVALGIPHPVSESVPICVVALHAGAQASPEEIRDHARARIGVIYPRLVLVVDAIPRSEQGKLDAVGLHRLVASRLG
jgi:acyl-coenzyme A synthetase/AMP-(fatty) acid ligase